MPLRDHFHPPWSEQNPWEGFHSAWVNTMVRQLNGAVLSRRFRAVPQVHLGPFVETDVATFEQDQPSSQPPSHHEEPTNGGGTAIWAPPAALQSLEVEFPAQDVFEVRIFDDRRGMRLVAVVELVSPGNKDRAENRQAFIAKCAAYLQEQVGVVIVDVVTSRHANMHQELLEMFSLPEAGSALSDLYAVSYRNRREKAKWRLETWPAPLAIGSALPTMPLWLAGNLAVPLDLEKSYEETCQVLRIE